MSNTKHGMNGTSVYRTWISIRARCNNPNDKDYAYYGGRGVKVCDRWMESFENFYADMGDKPTSQHSIDRYPDNDGNYEPGNCRWATKRQQRVNSRPHSKSGVRGVILTDRKKNPYDVMMSIKDKYTYLGSYPTLETAREARLKAEKEHWDDSYS